MTQKSRCNNRIVCQSHGRQKSSQKNPNNISGKALPLIFFGILVVAATILITPYFSEEQKQHDLHTIDEMEVGQHSSPNKSQDTLSNSNGELTDNFPKLDVENLANAPRDIDKVPSEANTTKTTSDLDSLEEQQERLALMKQKAQEYSEKRQALLQKCKDYDELGMLEEKKLECLDYLAELRANMEVKERQELRKQLKQKHQDDDNG